MKTLIFLLIPVGLFGQVIESMPESITMKDGTVVSVTITDEDDQYVYFEKDGKDRKVQKAVLKDYYRGELWKIPFKYDDSGNVSYSEVVKVDSVKKDLLFNAARVWFADLYTDSKIVLELDDRESGVLVGTGWSDIYSGMVPAKLWTTVKIEVKDERYRYTLSNIQFQHQPHPSLNQSKQSVNRIWPDGKELPRGKQKFKESTLRDLQSIIDSIKSAMEKTKHSDSNW